MAGIEFVWISLVKAEKSTWGAFAQANEPTGMVCRRLLQLSGSASSYACAEWDLLDGLPASAEVEIGSMREATQASSERWRWIPNTGEFLVLDNVAVRVRNKAGLALPLDTGYTVRLKGAYDRFWDANKGGDANGNIYNNKAMGINVAALNIGGSIDATVTLSTITEANGERLYSAASDDIGSFTVSKGGWLEKEGMRARLGIRPLSAATAYPGDDYVLSFTVEYAAGGTGTPVSLEARTDAKDYVAVYDKKMLWRANLYIDQKEETLGKLDWNDAHPWCTTGGTGASATVAWWGVNDWQGDGNGGQIELKEWTRWNDNQSVQKTVAYGWGCWDSVESFNDELVEQSGAIKDKRDENESYENLDSAWQEGQTKAPGTASQWHNYLFPIRKISSGTNSSSGASYNFFAYGQASSPIGVQQHLWQQKGTDSGKHISVPGLTTFMAFNGDTGNTNNPEGTNYAALAGIASSPNKGAYDYNQTLYSSGIDCSGLAHRSALYAGNGYAINIAAYDKLGAKHFSGAFTSAWINGANRNINATLKIREGSWKLESKLDLEQEQKILDQMILTRAVPGDLLVIDSHVVLIQNLHYELGETVIKRFQDVDILHSTQGGKDHENQWNVQAGNWEDLGDIKKIEYLLCRYR